MQFKVFKFKKVKSTNDTAIRIIKKNIYDYGMITSETQNNGRGQYGRKWISYKGNIFLSFFYKLEKINLSIGSLTKKNCLLVKKVISKSKHLLKINGKLILEIGYDQKYKVIDFLRKKNFFINKIIKDYGKKTRCIVSTKIY